MKIFKLNNIFFVVFVSIFFLYPDLLLFGEVLAEDIGSYKDDRAGVVRMPTVPNQLPRFVSLKFGDANLRTGPGSGYPIKFHFNCKWYPLEVIAEFEHWRLVRDVVNHRAWIRSTMVSGLHRSAVIVRSRDVPRWDGKQNLKNIDGVKKIDSEYNLRIEKNKVKVSNEKEVVLLSLPDTESAGIVRIEIGVVVRLLKCRRAGYCKISTSDGQIGWVERKNLWGIYDDERL
jgi:SH3-like domain-containing protein